MNGSALLVKIGGTVLSCQTNDSSLSFTRDMIETTCKDSTGSAKTYIPGEKDATIDVEQAYAVTTMATAFSDFDNGTEITWQWGPTASAEKSYTGNGYISDLSASAPQNDRATFSFTIQVSGPVTEQVNP